MHSFESKIAIYFQSRKEVVAVYLFGSYAKGQEMHFSDLDLGIVLHHSALKRSFEFQNQYIVDLGRLLRKDIHAVILNSVGELLLKQVFQTGHLVCINNDDQLKQLKFPRFE